MKLDAMTDKELNEIRKKVEDETNLREARVKAAALARRIADNEEIVKNIDAYLAIVPEHTGQSYYRTVKGQTCSDKDGDNTDHCSRCALLTIKRDGWLAPELTIRVSITVVEESP